MIVLKLLAGAAAAGAAFAPFYVGPALNGDGVTHITEYADNRAAGIASCNDELRWYTRGTADCRVEPNSQAPDTTEQGWALSSGPSWASKNPEDYKPSPTARTSKSKRATNFWGVQDVDSADWVSPWSR